MAEDKHTDMCMAAELQGGAAALSILRERMDDGAAHVLLLVSRQLEALAQDCIRGDCVRCKTGGERCPLYGGN